MARTYREPEVRQIGPVMWKSRPSDEWSLQRWREQAEWRAILMEESSDFFEAVVELAEVEADYQTKKNLKKNDPPTFYTARNRLYRARHEVRQWDDHQSMLSSFHPKCLERLTIIDQLQTRIRRREREAKDKAFYEPTAFQQWVRKQLNTYFIGKCHPERVRVGVFGGATAASRPEVQPEIAITYLAYLRLWYAIQEEGVDAAIEHYRTITKPYLNDWQARHGAHDYGMDERKYWNDGKPNTKYIEDSWPLLGDTLNIIDPVKEAERRAQAEKEHPRIRRGVVREMREQGKRRKKTNKQT